MIDPDLWQRLCAYEFPLDDQGRSLLSDLDHTTDLGAAKLHIALNEYRCFLYLAAVSTEILAPSPLIDHIWHHHIHHTRAYFDDFCANIIGRVIHHNPGRVGADRDPAYLATLTLYESEFGDQPFDKVWPRPTSAKPLVAVALFLCLSIAVFLFTSRVAADWFPFWVPLLVLVLAAFHFADEPPWIARPRKD